MTRLRRYCPAGIPVHVIQRGNNRSDCFHSDQDKATYFKYLEEVSSDRNVAVHAWVLMSNHVHLLVTPREDGAVSRLMQFLGQRYVRYFNRKHSRSGTLWEGRFRSCLIQSEGYFLLCQRYIELNPVRAGLVVNPGDFHWSSYKANALGIDSSLLTPNEIYQSLGKNAASRQNAYKALFGEAITAGQLEDLRETVNKGLVFGSPAFKDQIQRLSGQRVRPGKRGRKPAESIQFYSDPNFRP